MQRKGFGSRTKPRAQARARELVDEGLKPLVVVGTLEREFGDDAPSERWVKYLIALKKAKDAESDPWDFMAADPDDAAAVIDVLAVVGQRTGKRGFTKAEADAIARVRRAVADVPPWTAYLLARQFLVASTEEADLLVEYLASAPWRRDGRYETAAEAAGLIPHSMEGRNDDESETK